MKEMKMKNLISIVFLLAVIIQLVNAQEKSKNDVTPDEINKATLKLIEYYESYEDGSTESQRRAKHDNAVEELTRGAATSKDKNDAYKIYLTKKYDIAFNSTLNKFICENKLFDNVEEALEYGKDLDWQENKVFYEIASKAANTNERIIDISEVKGDGVFLVLKIVIALAIVGILLIKFSP
jgi:hypothetical protein